MVGMGLEDTLNEVKIATLIINCDNLESYNLAKKLGFELFEKRITIGYKQPNMESDSNFYYRKYRDFI